MERILLLFIGCLLAHHTMAQKQGLYELAPISSPIKEYYRQQITNEVFKRLDKIDWNHVEKTTTGGTVLYTIPVVVHVLHNYGTELVTDDEIYSMVDILNSYFLKTNADTASIVAKFKSIAANTQISFKLATIAPDGSQTKGIGHEFSYLTYSNYPDQSKINQWPQDKYLNIWTLNDVASGYVSSLAGYSYSAYDASYEPYYDGVLIRASYFLEGSIPAHYVAEYLNLPFPCSCCGGGCADNDGIADTPPCIELYSCANLYDTTCDTPNVQNIMNEGVSCDIMFTYGQGQYMQNILQLDFGNRDSLVTPTNFYATGMNHPMPDMLPVADFSTYTSSIYLASQPPARFFCEGQSISFKNQSWNDTIIAASWTFSNDANTPASSSITTVDNKFHQPGWVNVSLTVTGNNTGNTTLTIPNYIFIADSVPTNAIGYVQEFTPGSMDKWPSFNYYNNSFLWQPASVGYHDNSSMEYTSYDARNYPQKYTGGPQGDIDDLFTQGFDLSGFSDSCYLNFMTSGATRTSAPHSMTDSMVIEYAVGQATNWSKLVTIKGSELANKGAVTTAYTPTTQADWIPHAISLPAAALTSYTLFRLRYYPGADSAGYSSGNNFYLDNFNFSGFPEAVQVIDCLADGVSLMPNPTQGSTYVVIKDKRAIVKATIFVTDAAGSIVYETTAGNTNILRIEIPARVLAAKGLYMIHVITDDVNQTEKLVVY